MANSSSKVQPEIKKDATLMPSKIEEEKKKKVEYYGAPQEIYEFLKSEYAARRGISFTIGGMHIDSKLEPDKIEAKKKEEASKRAAVLVDFWKQSYSSASILSKSRDKSMRKSQTGNISATGLNETKKSEGGANQIRKILKEKLSKASEEEIKFTLEQDILKEINDAQKEAEKSKLQNKVLQDSQKLEEEKRMFQKALNMHYAFERENLADKEYTQTLVWTYREIKQKFPLESKEIIEWWTAYPDKEKRKINRPEAETREILESFYSDKSKISRLEQLYKGLNKFYPKTASDLIKYWKTIKVFLLYFTIE